MRAFERVEAARRSVPLTYFEFGTLAALVSFAEAGCDTWLLEVGLGGRLDAVNALDADVALITTIGLDHQEWLGDSIEAIAAEKAGILRGGNAGVLRRRAGCRARSARGPRAWVPTCEIYGRDFGFARDGATGGWTGTGPAAAGSSASTACWPRPTGRPAQFRNATLALAALARLTPAGAADRRIPEPGAAALQPAWPLPGGAARARVDPGCGPQSSGRGGAA